MKNKQCFYLIDHEPTDAERKEMLRWNAILQAEIERVKRVTDYWPFRDNDGLLPMRNAK